MAIRTSMASLFNSIPLPLQPTAVRSVFFLAFLAIQIQLVCIAGIRADDGDVLARQLRSREFDYFKLALQWPGTYCRKTRHCCSSNGCCRGSNAPTGFTIHGLWPDYNDGSWPSCCHGKRFDLKEVKTLLGALNKYWPSLSCSSSSNCHGGKGLFWEHEWEKHGTCCSAVTGDEYSYFLTALNIYFKYNVTEVLREAGYVPSNSEKYPLGGTITAIQNAFNTTPELECSKGAVEELRLCFTKKFELRDCAADASNGITSKKSCPQYVSLPDYSSSSRLGSKSSNEPEPQLPESKLQSSI